MISHVWIFSVKQVTSLRQLLKSKGRAFLGFVYQNSMALGDFPGGTVVKNLPANAGDTGSSPGN